jgi:5-dehydro-2-deoxygluconokinase
MPDKKFDVVCIGRSSIDLYSDDIGEPFENIGSFSAYVGGCPTNISVGTRRLGLRSSLLTGVGDDPVGDFILNFLKQEGVDASLVATKPGRRSSAVILGIEPPDKFPLVYYRENCADINIDVDDVKEIPFDQTSAILISGTGFSKDPSRSATLYAAERATAEGAKVILDIDYRPDQWPDLLTFGSTIRSVLGYVDIIIGTSEEIKAAASMGKSKTNVTDSQVSNYQVEADQDEAVELLLSRGPEIMVLKSGSDGCYLYEKSDTEPEHVPGFKVEVKNVLGAGDAFASGFIYGYIKGWDWYKCARLGNACGAMLVTRHGCANFMPTMDEIKTFTDQQGGL